MDALALQLTRVLPAPRRVVFASFTDPAELVRWWGPEGFGVRTDLFEPVVGGAYRLEMRPPGGEPFHVSGRFRSVEPIARLAFTFAWDPPDADDLENTAELAFQDGGETTDVALTQAPFKTAARRELHRDGWTQSFDKLERLLGGRGAT